MKCIRNFLYSMDLQKLLACMDGLKGFPEAIESVFQQAQAQLPHCPSTAQLVRLRLMERAQGGGRRAQANLHGSDGRTIVDVIRGLVGRSLSDDPAELAQELSAYDSILSVPG